MRKDESSLQNFLNKINPRTLFLVDGVGALVSAVMLGVVLVQLEPLIGMPRRVLYVLALIPCFFMVYSFLCFLKPPQNWKFFMRMIAIANLSYCALTLGLVIYLFPQLTVLGFTYFILEIIVVVTLVIIELKTASHFPKNHRI